MSNFNIDYLVIAGGGGGGSYGGGGAGGMLTGTLSSVAIGTVLNIDVGTGGAGGGTGATSSGYFNEGVNGLNSSISGTGITTVTSIGGGRGGDNEGSTSSGRAGDGGSGGGGSDGNGGALVPNAYGGSGTSGQGNSGGNGYHDDSAPSPYQYFGGSGGGAGAVGGSASSSGATAGGNGLPSSITGTQITYAGGGGGVMYNRSTAISGGTGGGGNGGVWNSSATSMSQSTAGTDGLGGGGGAGKKGGDGIIILRYATSEANYTTTGLTPTETTDGTYTVLSFTTVGTGSITFTLPPFNGTAVSNEMLDLNQQNNEIGLRIPVGDDANQPTPDVSNTGSIRYNTDHQALSISNGTEFQIVDSEESTLPTVTLTNSWRAWDTASFVNGGTSCTDVTGGLVLGPYSSGSPGAFFYGSFNNVAGNKYWVLNGGGSHGRRAGFTRPTEFTISYWGNKPSNPGYNSERAIWSFNIFGSDNIRLARRNNAGTSSLRIYSGNSSIATFADGITTSTWYNITLTFSSNTVKTYVGVQGSTNTTLINTTTLSSGNFPTGISNDSNGTGFWIGTNSGYTDWSTDSWSGLNVYDGVARQAEIDTIVSNGYQQ